MRRLRTPVTILALALGGAVCAQTYRFEVDPDNSFTNGSIQIRLWTIGSFKGDFDPESNPNGTRTKAGMEGEFKDAENSAVLAQPFWELAGTGIFRTKGAFDLTVDTGQRTATLTNYSVERLGSGPTVLAASCALNSEPFRTLAPESAFEPQPSPVYLYGLPVNSLVLKQRPGVRTGSVTPMEDGWYRVSVTFMADVELIVPNWGQPAPIRLVVPASLVGNFKRTSEGALFGYPRGLGGDNLAREIDVALDEMPMILPVRKDDKSDPARAGLRLLTNVGKVSIAIKGVREFRAVGRPVETGFWGLWRPKSSE